MCGGQYPEGEKVVWTSCDSIGETTFDNLFKQNALLAVASIMLRMYPNKGVRNDLYGSLQGSMASQS